MDKLPTNQNCMKNKYFFRKHKRNHITMPHILITKQHCFSESTSVVNRPDGYIQKQKAPEKGCDSQAPLQQQYRAFFCNDGSSKQVS